MLTYLLMVLTSIAIVITSISGLSFIRKKYVHKKAMSDHSDLDKEVQEFKKIGDPIKLQDAVDRRSKILDKIFGYQADMSRSNYYLAIGATTFAFIELIKLIVQIAGPAR